MKIVVLDCYTLNPGDLDISGLNKFGALTVYDRTAPDKIIERAKDADIVLTNKTVLNRETISQLTKVKYIGLLSTGTNAVDLIAAREKGIPVTNIPAYSTPSVAQLTFALILEIYNGVGVHNSSVQRGEWSSSPDFCYWLFPLTELQGKTIGLIGLGSIGKQVARIANAFDMKVLAYRKKTEPVEGVAYCSLEYLLQNSDIISLHCPLNDETANIINEHTLRLMKTDAIIINTGRGGLIDEQKLAGALNQGRIAAAGLDVLVEEPPKTGSPLIGAKNCYITPHIAWGSKAARERLLRILIGNIEAFLEGNRINVVN